MVRSVFCVLSKGGGITMKTKLTLWDCLKDLRIECNLYLEELSNLTGIFKSALGRGW